MLVVRCPKSMAQFAFANMGAGGEMGLWLGDLDKAGLEKASQRGLW